MALHVLATFVAREDTIAEVQELMQSLVEPIRADQGCLKCELVVNNADPAELIFIEEWTDESALDQHLGDAFVGEVVAKAEPLLARPFTLTRHTPAG